MDKPYTGQCLCGAIRYEAVGQPMFMGNCHCRDCQRSSGGAFVPAMLFRDDAVQVEGEPRFYSSPSDKASQHSRGFCPHCGSQLFARFERMPGMLGIKAGTLNEPRQYRPMLDFFVTSAAPWCVMNPDLPKRPGPA
ncbi:MAG TPA: GFA family protein [Limnobacter sp.]|uniref:GFA family protein n=1 Tax=Limnobacter sp. TaxID=2003368 RepID=UPI002ED8904D